MKKENTSIDRMVILQINETNISHLKDFLAKSPDHPAAKVASNFAEAPLNPPYKSVEAKVLSDLINLALQLEDENFLLLVRDIITNLVCSFDSFQGLVNAEHYKPQFDLNNIEQQFLSDEYLKAKHRQKNTEEA